MSATSRAGRRLPILLTLGLSLAACGGGEDRSATEPASDPSGAPASANEVTIDGFMFMPADIEVAAGTTVTWTNEEAPVHSIQDEGDLFPESQELGEGEGFTFTYDTPGQFPYVCGIHPYMKGTVTVS